MMIWWWRRDLSGSTSKQNLACAGFSVRAPSLILDRRQQPRRYRQRLSCDEEVMAYALSFSPARVRAVAAVFSTDRGETVPCHLYSAATLAGDKRRRT